LLTRSNRRNLPQATWDRLVRLLLARELDRLDAFQRLLPVSGTKQHESLMGLSPAMAADISAKPLEHD
jgi:hypothetical protein